MRSNKSFRFSQVYGRQVGRTATIKGTSPHRNEFCPCGSGLKFKRCHGSPKRIPIYDCVGQPVEDNGSNPAGYVLVTGGEDDVPAAELIAYLKGEHRHARRHYFLLSAGDENTGLTFRFATPWLAEAYVQREYPGKPYLIAALPATWQRMETKFTPELLFSLPE